MNKTVKIVIIAAIVVVAIVGIVFLTNSKPKTNLDPITSAADLTSLVDKVYEGLSIELPMLQTQEIDIADDAFVQSITGLENANDLEYIVASEPLMSAQAYSLVLVKVKDGVNTNEIAKKMNENIDARKWICVEAEKVYTTSSGDVVCLVMSNKDTATTVYNKFKELAGNVGEEFERTQAEPSLPDELLPELPVENDFSEIDELF